MIIGHKNTTFFQRICFCADFYTVLPLPYTIYMVFIGLTKTSAKLKAKG